MNRSVFITGVSSGIGLALAKEYLQRGWAVYGLSRRDPAITETQWRFQSADLGALAKIPATVKKLLEGVGELDLVILNAGMLGRIADVSETPVEEMKEVIEVNLWANKVVLDTVFEQGRRVRQVVAVSSGAGTTANRGWNAYAISKAGLNMLIGLYAAERPETHFCALAPGIVDTAMQDRVAEIPQDGRYPSLDMLRMAKGSPMMPSGEEIAPRLIEGIERASKYASGSFLDVHSLVKRIAR